ncbi:MAG: FGGY family carbohydrate kinase [Pseudomonadota bacterium]
MADLVLGVDASTTAVKAVAFDRYGKPHAEARATYPLHRPAAGHFEQDAPDWWAAFCDATGAVATAIGAERIAALAIGVQRETFVLLDRDGTPTHPAILWLDERARAEVSELSDLFSRETLRQITGKPPDPTPALYALRWLRKHRPETLACANVLLDVHGYLTLRLTGKATTALPAADPLGLVDLGTGTFHPDLVAAAGLGPAAMPRLCAAGTQMGTVSAEAAQAAGLSVGTPLFAGGGDGQITGLGLGAIQGDDAYLSIGSGIVTGMLVPDYRTDDAFRTLASPTGNGFMVETVIRSGMQLIEWVCATTGQSIEQLENEAAKLPPGSDGLLCLPYFAGAMNPHWDDAARGTYLGLSLSHTPAHLFRAAMEGLAFEQALATAAMETSLGVRAEHFIACGGGLKSKILPPVLAAVLGRPIAVSPVQEGVALGSAILAATGTGWFHDIDAAVSEMVEPPETVHRPDPTLEAQYAPLSKIYADFYQSLAPLQARLNAV